MKKIYLFNFLFLVGMVSFNGCGGSSSSFSSTDKDENENQKPTLYTAESEPYFKYSWHIESKDSYFNTNGYSIDKNADIDVIEAWKITKGNGVKVAVIDDAFDVEHEDLKANIFITYNADDDSSDVSNKEPIDSEYGTSHGNICAGFIVAPINGKGIVGIAPEAKLIAIQLLGDSDSVTIKAFEYAKNQGAKVVSCSWGTENISPALEVELKSLYDAGITILFASGNDGKSLDEISLNDESESQWVIGVGASGENNDVTSYSNYGSNIDILAPGGDMEISIGILGIDDSGERGSKEQQSLVSENYAFTNGTSFSTPVAAGVVALMYGINPNITPKKVREILIESSDKIGLGVTYDTNGFNEKRAYGKINANTAVVKAQESL